MSLTCREEIGRVGRVGQGGYGETAHVEFELYPACATVCSTYPALGPFSQLQ